MKIHHFIFAVGLLLAGAAHTAHAASGTARTQQLKTADSIASVADDAAGDDDDILNSAGADNLPDDMVMDPTTPDDSALPDDEEGIDE